MSQVYFALLSEENFLEVNGSTRKFSYRQFYLGIIETVRLWSEDDIDALLLWWNLLNGGSALCPYNVNQILLTSNPMPVALLSDLMIQIPLS